MANKIQILRNGTISTSREAAKTALMTKLVNLTDGEIAINRYQAGTQVKVLLGFNNTVGTDTKQFIFDSDAIPADVQTQLDAITGDSGSIAKLKTELIGTTSDTSSANTINGAKKYAEEKATAAVNALDVTDSIVTSSFVASVSETDGKIKVTKGEVASADSTVTVTGNANGSIDLKANIDGTTIVKDGTTGVLSVASSALTQYVGSNAISVGAVSSDNKKTISLGINTNDKVLSQSASGLLATLSIGYDSTNKKIQLKGNNSAVVSEFDASAFVKDGMLADAQVFTATAETQTVTFDDKTTNTYTGLTKGHHYVAFEFNVSTGGTVTEHKYDILDATSIVDVYEAGNGLALSDHKFSVKKDSASENFLSVGTDGVKVSGVQTAINTAAAKATTVVNTKSTGHVTVTSATATDGHVTYTVNESDIASASGLSTEIARAQAAEKTNSDAISAETSRAKGAEGTNATNISTEVTRAKGVENAVIGGVGLNTDGSHKTTTGNYTSKATTVVGEISALDAQVKTNANAITALQNAKVSVAASTDTESAKYLSVSANDAKTVYTVKASGIDAAIKVETDRAKTAESAEVTNRNTAITNAINALDVTAVGGTGKVITTVSETDGKISATAIELKAANVAATATAATDTAVAVTGTTVAAQIASLATSIAKIDCGTY